jgi:hypothetical protein
MELPALVCEACLDDEDAPTGANDTKLRSQAGQHLTSHEASDLIGRLVTYGQRACTRPVMPRSALGRAEYQLARSPT